MGIIVNIIDAIRRVGSPSQKSALRRQDEHLSNKAVTSRRVETDRSEVGRALSFVATTEPIPETVRPFDSSELLAIEENSAQVSILSQRYLNRDLPRPTPDELDAIFKAWAHSPERNVTSNEEIVQILGAAFGSYCVQALDMKWVIVTDADGTAAAIQGTHKDFRGFPFHSIWKRIGDNEHDFFAPIFVRLQKQREVSKEVKDVN